MVSAVRVLAIAGDLLPSLKRLLHLLFSRQLPLLADIWDCPVQQYLALESMMGHNLQHPSALTRLLSGLTYLARCVMFDRAMTELDPARTANPQDRPRPAISSRSDHAIVAPHLAQLERASCSAYFRLREVGHILFAAAKTEARLPRIRWQPGDATTLFVGASVRFSISDIAKSYRRGMDRLRKILRSLVAQEFHSGMTQPPLEDDLWCRTHGYWAGAEQNEVLLDDSPGGPWCQENGRLRNKEVTAWLQQAHQASKLIMALAHLSGGMPARGTEAVSLRYVNCGPVVRNVYFTRGQALLLATYGKQSATQGRNIVIGRFLPRELSCALFFFLAKIRVMECDLAAALGDTDRSTTGTTYLFTGPAGQVSSDTFCRSFASTLRKLSGQTIGIRDYRQAVRAFTRRLLPSERVQYIDGFCEQMGHSSNTANSSYARDDWSIPGLEVDALWVVVDVGMSAIDMLIY